MKTNVSIEFNSIEEYREIEKKLEEIGYVNDKKWNDIKNEYTSAGSVDIYNSKYFCIITNRSYYWNNKTYNSLEEFLKGE